MLPETSEFGMANGYMVYGDENRNIAFETLPNDIFPHTLIIAITQNSFNYILNIFLLKDAIQRKNNHTSISGHRPQFSMHEDFLRMPGNCRVLTILKK